ncbi:hypothetical protein [Porphyrobacter sp. CACIAM 03H1]|uniref:hypothetical protein n=1 Tax=Porphyrobacter sp. CACIAM 03H1 TaxID=2003315 RepID=UPI000B5A8F04|nr:hypothetical protein [Porphyrobacter sp. CACIAM 03H1]ASJ90381.1 hypothetical protein CBR61_05215 [Porphyrobacter sp. CACIAM 03H1]
MTRAQSRNSPRTATRAKLCAVPDTPADTTPKPTRHDSWPLDLQAAFLRALSATHSVSEAAKSVGKSRQSAYRLRSRLKGKPFDLAWEVAFHHSYDVLAHTALERALNGVEVPVFFQGEQVGSYRRFDERLTVALLQRFTAGGNPLFGRLAPLAERHARDFEALLAKVEAGEPVVTGALAPEDAGEHEVLRARFSSIPEKGAFPCPSALSDDELMKVLQENGWGE